MTLPPWWHRVWYRLVNDAAVGWLWLFIGGMVVLLVWLVAWLGVHAPMNPQDTLQGGGSRW